MKGKKYEKEKNSCTWEKEPHTGGRGSKMLLVGGNIHSSALTKITNGMESILGVKGQLLTTHLRRKEHERESKDGPPSGGLESVTFR